MDKQAEPPVPVPVPGHPAFLSNGDNTVSYNHAAFNKELLNSALWGAGLTAGGSILYQMLNGMRSARVPELLRNSTPEPVLDELPSKKKKSVTKFAEQCKSATNLYDSFMSAANTASTAVQGAANTAGTAVQGAANTASTAVQNAANSAMRTQLIPTQFFPGLDGSSRQNGLSSLNTAHAGWRQAFNIAAALAGGYGGIKAIDVLADKKKKEDRGDEVDSARKEYFDALQGKSAAVLDAAFDEFKKVGGMFDNPSAWTGPSEPIAPKLPLPSGTFHATVPTSGDKAVPFSPPTTANPILSPLWTTALLAALGSGAVGATYMYNQTKSRSKAVNLQRAAAARARLQGLQQTAWVDPEQLAALSQNSR